MMRVLILMATRTYRAEAFLRAASRLAVDVTIGTEVEQLLGGNDEGATLAVDIRDPRRAARQIADFHARHPLDAVIGVDDDTTLVAAQAAEALGLPHNSVESVKASRYKDVMRLILSETGLNVPRFELVALATDPRAAAKRVQYPCVLKPLALAASRGVIRADDEAGFVVAFEQIVEILEATDLATDDLARKQLLVESFIPGREFALEGLLRAGRLTVLALFDKPDPLDGPYFEETIYVTPSRLPRREQSSIEAAVSQACEALGLREGPIHAEVRLNSDGPWVIEVAARSIGGKCSDALRFGADVALEELIIRQAVGLELPSTLREGAAAGVMMIPIPAEGTLCNVQGRADAKAVPGIEEVIISIPYGHRVVPLPWGDRYLGFIQARGRTPEEVEAALREAHGRLAFDIRAHVPARATPTATGSPEPGFDEA